MESMAGSGIEPGTPVSLVRCSTTDLAIKADIHSPSILKYHTWIVKCGLWLILDFQYNLNF